jgi:hypothetical protein
MEKDLKQPINVVNRTGGSGVVGHDAIAKAPADGYTIGLITVEIAMMHHQGLTALTPTDYTPIGLVNADPRGSWCAPIAVQEHEGPDRGDQGQSGQDEGLGHRPGRHLAPRDRGPC